MVIGVARSGTTLLRLMLNAHPDLAIPPETGFVGQAAALLDVDDADRARDELLSLLTGFHTWRFLGIDDAELERALAALDPFDVSEGVRSFYALYAARFEKRRFGDKTPNYTMEIAAVRSVLPEAHIVHVIRDGRDVALSVRGLPFSPGSTMEEIARDWVVRVETARREGRGNGEYLEVRFEDLVAEPRRELQRVCAFISLPFDERHASLPRRRRRSPARARLPTGEPLSASRAHARATAPRARAGVARADDG